MYFSSVNSSIRTPAKGTKIAAGPEGASYYKFTKKLSEKLGGFATILPTKGSVENLQLLSSGGAEFAIVQSDTAYFAYYGLRGLPKQQNIRLVSPLFKEKVRLYVSSDAGVNSLSDLTGKKICVGSIGSGTYFNSISVLTGIGLTADLDFIPIYLNSAACLKRANQRNDIGAFFQTSQLPLTELLHFEESILPVSVIDQITENHSYFKRLAETTATGKTQYHLGLDAYLITTSEVSNVEVMRMANSLFLNWKEISEENSTSVQNPNTNFETAIPYHLSSQYNFDTGANINNGIFISPWVLSFWLILLLLCLYAERQKSTYNRLGDSILDAWFERHVIRFMGKFSQILIGTSLAFFAIAIAVLLLKFFENIHARSSGTQSPFLDLGFVDSLLWLFSYIAGGFTKDGIYPQSIAGQVITAFLAIVGVLGPFTAIILFLNIANRKAKRVLLGYGNCNFKGHVLVCGWNEKAPGIIYTLTGNDVDERKKVVLVGDIPETNPYASFRFDPKYVSFIRGAPSDLSALRKANVNDASAALILADLNTSSQRNADSVLTAMHIRRENPDIHICSELEYKENSDLFMACGSNVVIDAHNIITRLAASAIISPEIIDYVLDTITYHDFDELYSARVIDEKSLHKFLGRPLRELEVFLLRNGVNIVGLLEERKELNQMTLDEFSSLSNLTALVDQKDSRKTIQENSVIIFAAKTRSQIQKTTMTQQFDKSSPLTDKSFDVKIYPNMRVFACGDMHALNDLRANLQTEGANIEITEVDMSIHQLNTYEDVKKHVVGEYEKVIILLSREARASFSNEHEMHNVDAKNILLTRLVQKVFENQSTQPIIIAELLAIKNKQLFIDAGAEIVLPSSLIVERFLTKEVFNNTNVIQYVLALLNRSDGVYLHSHKVTNADGFCGVHYNDILNSEIEGLRIVGWLPLKSRDALKNTEKDFDFHFRTVIDERNISKKIEAGDILILVIRPRSRYYAVS